MKRSDCCQILREATNYRIYDRTDDIIKTGFQAKKAASKKVAIWILIFVTILIVVDLTILEAAEIV